MHGRASLLARLSIGIRPRLLLILGIATGAVLIASAMALVALLELRTELRAVTERALPASDAALVLARVGERLQDRTPALMMAKDLDARRRQTELIRQDLLLLAGETERLLTLHPSDSDGVDAIAALAPALAANLRELAELLERRAVHAQAIARQRGELTALRERVQQTLGPSILAVSDAVDRAANADSTLFRKAAVAQGPLLETERLTNAAFRELLIATTARDTEQLAQTSAAFQRNRAQLSALVPSIPAGLRPELADAVAALGTQLGADGVLAQRDGELAALAAADGLVATSRHIAAELKVLLDTLVLAANQNIARAADRMGDSILSNTVLLVTVSVAVLLLATALSYRFVVSDISSNLRAVTDAMQRLAGGQRTARVPAMERRDEIGDLARVFDVFKEQAFEVQTLHRQLLDKSSLLMTTFETMNDGFTVHDADGRLLAWNPQVLALYGLSATDLHVGVALADIHRGLAARGVRFFTTLGEPLPLEAVSESRTRHNQQFEIRCPDGRTVELRSNPTPQGGFVTLHMDVTEPRAIEGQLRQAQKMEAVGQLTGGIAHDFNNILGAILGNLTLLEPPADADPERRERWRRAMGAADRAARQVERLLAFSRRQRLTPEVVDINALAAGMLDLLQVSLGERIDLRTALAPHLPAVRVDPGQLENALMNLALNARDAMPDGGTLRIDTAGTGDGTVEIAVTDTGSGIPPAVIERVCEPFFTTKPRGKGSGLGLSMVYGFARQSGGDMEIDSTPGLGTRVRIRLPVADGRPQAARAPDETADGATAGEAPRGHGETLLVVDDDPDVLGSTAAGLRALGYRVLTAGNPAEALAHLDREPDIRVLYTDVCMPNPGDGARLARAALARSPGLALLYTSGAVQTVDDPDAGLLAKPVALTTLAHRLRQLLQPAAG